MNNILFFSALSTFLVGIYSILFIRKAQEFKWVLNYCIFNAIIEALTLILAWWQINNIILIYVLVFGELFFLIKYFSNLLENVKWIGSWKSLVILFLLLISTFAIKHPQAYINPNPQIIEGLYITFLCLLFFNKELKHPKYTNILIEPSFWFIVGFLFYYGCSLLILLSTNYFFEAEKFIYVWNIHNLLYLIKNIFLIVGLICLSRLLKS